MRKTWRTVRNARSLASCYLSNQNLTHNVIILAYGTRIMSRCAKIFSLVLFVSVCATFLIKLCLYFWAEFIATPPATVDTWLEQNHLGSYKQLFRKKGKR